jgi:hypothetical protein
MLEFVTRGQTNLHSSVILFDILRYILKPVIFYQMVSIYELIIYAMYLTQRMATKVFFKSNYPQSAIFFASTLES